MSFNFIWDRIQLCAPPTSSYIDHNRSRFCREGFILSLYLEDGSVGYGEVRFHWIPFSMVSLIQRSHMCWASEAMIITKYFSYIFLSFHFNFCVYYNIFLIHIPCCFIFVLFSISEHLFVHCHLHLKGCTSWNPQGKPAGCRRATSLSSSFYDRS